MQSEVCRVRCGVVIVGLLIASLLVGVVGCAPTEAEEAADWGTEEPVVMRLVTEVPETHPRNRACELFKQILESEFPGRLEVRNFPGGQLYNESEGLDAMLTGDVELAFVSTPKLTKYDRQIGVLSLPYLLPSEEAMWGIMESDLGRKVNGMVEAAGFKVFGYSPALSYIGICGKERILTIDWFAGKKIRVWDAIVQIPMMEAWGASAMVIAASEYASALETGVIDAIYTSDSGWVGSIRTVGPYWTGMVCTHNIFPLVCSPSWYDGLPADLQAAVDDAAEEMLAHQASESAKDAKELYEQYKATDHSQEGMIYMPVDEEARFVEASKPVYEQLEDVFGADLIAAAKAFRDKYA